MSHSRSQALDHVVLVLFENRSLDNLLGHLYGPEDGKTFEGVIGKELSNPIPEWAEHGAERKVVPYTVTTDMDAPNPDSGEEYFHTNTQLYNTLDEHNRFKIGEAVTAPWNVPPPGTEPTMDGFVTDYISTFTGEVGRQPTYEEYAQIMTGYTPEQVPVLSGLAKGFGVFDHWFCEVPSQTFMNRSFWTAGTSSGFVTNSPGDEVDGGEHRRDAVQPAGGTRTHLEGLRAGTVSPLVHGLDPHASAQGSPGDAHRAVLGVRARRGRRDAAGLQPDRADPGRRARRLPPGVRQIVHRRRRRHRHRPAVLDPLRRGLPGAHLPRDQIGRLLRGLERPQHHLLHRLGRARRNLRPRSSRSRCPRRTPAPPPGSATSPSTAPATACPRSSSPRGSTRAR